ncbi:pentatricopeptide repeat-containing protein [Canna indica]|uniref:Pentatricopeptide repeat-containing protein n=1 Tax=Canna indica TaxID=4628 RepID=A0AAQ3QRW5_9LILI|nr:pentatricopeptide repeat-containing protein [Canna indica]
MPACHHLLLSSLGTFKRRLAAGTPLKSPKSFKSYAETCAAVLRQCAADTDLAALGLALHAHALRAGISADRSVSAKIVALYALSRRPSDRDLALADSRRPLDLFSRNLALADRARSGDLAAARRAFDGMPERDVVTWTLMVDGHMKRGDVSEAVGYFESCPYKSVISFTAFMSGFVLNGCYLDALVHFRRMLASGLMPNEVTFTCVLKACVGAGEFELGKGVVGLIVKTNFDRHVSVQNSLITLYLRMGDVDLAMTVFGEMEEKDVVSWTAILDVYAKMGDLKEARQIFDVMPERNDVSWSTMIARYAQSGEAKEAVNLFCLMLHDGHKPNVSCLASVISASADCESLHFGSGIHCYTVKVGHEDDVFITSSLIDMYCKCKSPADGRRVFDWKLEKNTVCWNSMVAGYCCNGQVAKAEELFNAMTERNSVSWNAMISGYADNGYFVKALNMFDKMLVSKQMPGLMTFSSALLACASICSLHKGKNLHGKIVKLGIQDEVFMGTALVDMYAKSGDIASAKRVFSGMPVKNEVSWSAIIQGLAYNGFAEESITLFEDMKREAIAPTDATFLSVLFACSHRGMVDRGLQYFDSMEKVYGISPKAEHYTCIIDLLARAGHLREAEELISSMSIDPKANAWAALLSACSTSRDEDIGQRVAKRMWELEKENSAGYVLLSNIYASCGRWEDVAKVRTQMRRLGMKKDGGCSSIQIKDGVHTFFSWGVKHSKPMEVYEMLDLVMSEMTGYKSQYIPASTSLK